MTHAERLGGLRLGYLVKLIEEWMLRVPVSGPEVWALKTAKEATELVEEQDPDKSLVEGADVLICLLCYVLRRDLGANDLLNAAIEKMMKNADREWAEQPDGTWQHVPGS